MVKAKDERRERRDEYSSETADDVDAGILKSNSDDDQSLVLSGTVCKTPLREGVQEIDYKDIATLKNYITESARAAKINALETVTIASKAGDEGKLFGSIGTRDIADAVTAAGVDVAKSEVRLPNGVLRTT
ncbi:unnamed protein product, partial [Ranitomeya imitator]